MGVRKSQSGDNYQELNQRIARFFNPADEKANTVPKLDRGLWHAYNTVENDGARGDKLLEHFRTERRAAAARGVHKVVQQLVQLVTPPPARSRGPAEIVTYINRRAPQLGFAPAAIFKKWQGTRNPRYDGLKDARALIVAELCKDGASLRAVGRVLHRSPPVILELRNQGRELLADQQRTRLNDLFEQAAAADNRQENGRRD